MSRGYTPLYDCRNCKKKRCTPKCGGLCYKCLKIVRFPYSCHWCHKKNAVSVKGEYCKRCANKAYKAEHKFKCFKCGKKNTVTEKGQVCYSCSNELVREEYAKKHEDLKKQQPDSGCLIFLIPAMCFILSGVASDSDGASEFFFILFLLTTVGCIVHSFYKQKELDTYQTKVSTAKSLIKSELEERYRAKFKSEIKGIEEAIGFITHSGKDSPNAGKYYVYLHYSSRKKKVVYVGKGTKERDYSEKRTVQEHADLLKSGDLKVHRILDDVAEDVAFDQESYLIGLFGRIQDGGELFNIQSGSGDGVNHLPKYKSQRFTTTTESDLLESISKYIELKKLEGVSAYTISRLNTHLVKVSKEIDWSDIAEVNKSELDDYLEKRGLSGKTRGNYVASWKAFLSFLKNR